MSAVTTRAAVLAYIREHLAAHGYAPTLAEIAAAVGLGSRSGAAYYVRALVADGHLTREPKQVRGIICKAITACNEPLDESCFV